MTMTGDTTSGAGRDDGGSGPWQLTGRQLREQLADDSWLDEVIERAGADGVQLTG